MNCTSLLIEVNPESDYIFIVLFSCVLLFFDKGIQGGQILTNVLIH